MQGPAHGSTMLHGTRVSASFPSRRTHRVSGPVPDGRAAAVRCAVPAGTGVPARGRGEDFGFPGPGSQTVPGMRYSSPGGRKGQKRRISGRRQIGQHHREDEPYIRLSVLLPGKYRTSPNLSGLQTDHASGRPSHCPDVRTPGQAPESRPRTGLHRLPEPEKMRNRD